MPRHSPCALLSLNSFFRSILSSRSRVPLNFPLRELRKSVVTKIVVHPFTDFSEKPNNHFSPVFSCARFANTPIQFSRYTLLTFAGSERTGSENWTTMILNFVLNYFCREFCLSLQDYEPTNFCRFLSFSLERRWSSHTFRYGYLVTT